MVKNARNIVIVLALAALVVLIPGGGAGANTAIQAIWLAFLGSFAWVAYVLYRERRITLYSLGDAKRAVLYAAVAVGTLTVVAGPRLRETSTGKVVWIALLAVAAYAVFAVVWSARRY
jgi:drug/metabolite transporter (DMT)-like permease